MASIPKIRRNAEFQVIFKQGKIWSNALAALYLLRVTPRPSRIGICVSKKLGKATVRNRIKRLIHESCRLRWSQVKDGFDLIVLARRGSCDRKLGDIDRAIDELLRRARLYRSAAPTSTEAAAPTPT